MTTILHDPAVRDSIRARIVKLTPSATRAWGKMTVDQMLWHVNTSMENALGEQPPDQRPAVSKSLLRFAVLNLPWIKGAPTAPDLVAGEQRHDFETQKARCLQLIDAVTRRHIENGPWAFSPSFGNMSGREWSRFHAKHLDHHLKQFSV